MIPLKDNIPTERTPYVTVAVIAVCVLVYLWQASHPAQVQQAIVYSLGFIPATLFSGKELPPELQWVPPEVTLFTSMFLHGGLLHVAGNMLFLWIFGNNVEDSMGHVRFIIFYLLCGLAAAFSQGFSNPDAVLPMIGASGAVAGVLGAYLLLYPQARILVVIPLGFLLYPIRLPAMAVLGIWFLIQFLSYLVADPNQPGVAFLAHVGGFVTGVLLIPLFKSRRVKLFNRIE